jgi:hypothetical protein
MIHVFLSFTRIEKGAVVKEPQDPALKIQDMPALHPMVRDDGPVVVITGGRQDRGHPLQFIQHGRVVNVTGM